jgi:hypothetical protein
MALLLACASGRDGGGVEETRGVAGRCLPHRYDGRADRQKNIGFSGSGVRSGAPAPTYQPEVPAGHPGRQESLVKYMILIYGSQQDYDGMAGKAGSGEPGWSAADFAAMGSFMAQFNRELSESGELVDTRGLTAPVHARRIRLQGGAPVVTDGPYPETEEVLASYWIVDCDSFDRATAVAAKLTETPGPAQLRDRAVIDVRPLAESRDELRS